MKSLETENNNLKERITLLEAAFKLSCLWMDEDTPHYIIKELKKIDDEIPLDAILLFKIDR